MNAITKKQVVDDQLVFKLFDSLDDKIIEDELRGLITDTWVYQFKDRNKEIVGLSKIGVDQACILLTKKGNIIREDAIDLKPDPFDDEYVLFTAIVSQYAVNAEGKEILLKRKIGTKRQCRKLKLRDGSRIDDEFWYEKGSMKALRNATARLLDEDLKAQIIAFAREAGKTKVIKSEDETTEKSTKEDSIKTDDKKPVLNQTAEEYSQMKKFWAAFKEVIDYNADNKNELNNIIHSELYRLCGKHSLRDHGIDYGALLEAILEREDIVMYLKNKKGVSHDSSNK